MTKKLLMVALALLLSGSASAQFVDESYTNFETGHNKPIAVSPAGDRLAAINTPDAMVEIYEISPVNGTLKHVHSIRTGLEPSSLTFRTNTELWVVNHLSDSIAIVDVVAGITTEDIRTLDEPTDVVFAQNKAFVSVSQEDAVEVFDLNDLNAPTVRIDLFNQDTRTLQVSPDGTQVYAVMLNSGNQSAVVNDMVIQDIPQILRNNMLNVLGRNHMVCDGAPNPYPSMPPGVDRNPDPLLDPPAPQLPPTGLVVQWNEATQAFEDTDGQDWTHCLPFRLPDKDLFVIDAATNTIVQEVSGLGTTLFNMAINPANGHIYVPNTDARNLLRFEHPNGIEGHVIDNLLTIVDLNAPSVNRIDLNDHIDRSSDPATNLAERMASIHQPGQLVFTADGSTAYLTAFGSRKVFVLDGSCTSADCLFGPDRATPNVIESGEGPSGVALLESQNRLYVLNRFENNIALVDTTDNSVMGHVQMHDPSSDFIKDGRRLLYDGILSSGHGDAACGSCHPFGDTDMNAWDIGTPAEDFIGYSTPEDNIRFVTQTPDGPVDCDPAICASKSGFDPQKGPMQTQTLRGMMEPLHWRGDKPTFVDFNSAFIGLLGTADLGGHKGFTDEDMALFREFALGINFPPNPYRNVDDTLPDELVFFPHENYSGNPNRGEDLFLNMPIRGTAPCAGCHALSSFGTADGTMGGVQPMEPTAPEASGMFNGNDADFTSNHNDLLIPHLRNIYEKSGPIFGDTTNPTEAKTGFGLIHDGSVPNMLTFLSGRKFGFDSAIPQDALDIAAFQNYFPTEHKPSVGQSLTVPQGTPPTGTADEEALLLTLIPIADIDDRNRHCELTAATIHDGGVRRFRLSGGLWRTDILGQPRLTTTQLREEATAPITFVCAPRDNGRRLGGDRDNDDTLDGQDCAPADPDNLVAGEANGLRFDTRTQISWNATIDPNADAITYELSGGDLSDLKANGISAATNCLATNVLSESFSDAQPDPLVGEANYYLVRSRNACGPGTWGVGREAIDGPNCP